MTLAVPALPGGAPNTACKPVGGNPPALVASLLPSSRTVPVGATATFFATVINTGASQGSQVGVALASIQSQALLTFNAIACATNAVIGGDNVREDIAAGDRACFVVRLTPTAPLGPTEVSFAFAGANTAPAPTLAGVNTLMLLASTVPAPDLVALAATATGDGIVTAASPAACKAAPAPGVTVPVNAGQTPTFSVFVSAQGPVAFDPVVNRIFVELRSGGALVGRTSVAVRTP